MTTANRYAPNQAEMSRRAREIQPYCSYPGCWSLAVNLHHAIYRDRQGAIKGRELELLGVATFTLCDRHHNNRDDPECAHHKLNWYQGIRGASKFDARQRIHYYQLLTKGWDEKCSKLKALQSASC